MTVPGWKAEAIVKIQKSIEIATQADKIWPFISDTSNVMKWCSNVKKIHPTSEQNSGLGGTFYLEESAAGRLLKLHFVVTEWEINRILAFKMISGNLVRRYEQRYTLEPHSRGTRLTCFEHVALPLGIMGQAAGLFRKPISEARVQRMLDNLKGLGEA